MICTSTIWNLISFTQCLIKVHIHSANVTFAWEILLLENLEIEKTKPASFKSGYNIVGLVFPIFNSFFDKIYQANKLSVVYLHKPGFSAPL